MTAPVSNTEVQVDLERPASVLLALHLLFCRQKIFNRDGDHELREIPHRGQTFGTRQEQGL